jgi:hypothetical protein
MSRKLVAHGTKRQYPVAFHDITLGTNDIACLPGNYPDCNVPLPSGPYEDSYGKYAAGKGYDMASGLGSVDVNQMLSDWSLCADYYDAAGNAGERGARLGNNCLSESEMRGIELHPHHGFGTASLLNVVVPFRNV